MAAVEEAAHDLSLLLADLDQHGHHGHPLYRTRDRLAKGWTLQPPGVQQHASLDDLRALAARDQAR